MVSNIDHVLLGSNPERLQSNLKQKTLEKLFGKACDAHVFEVKGG